MENTSINVNFHNYIRPSLSCELLFHDLNASKFTSSTSLD